MNKQKGFLLLVVGLIIAGVLVVVVGVYLWQNYKSAPVTSTLKPTTTPSITVTSPNGGESWHPGNKYNIIWTSTGVNEVNIELLRGNNSLRVASNQSASTGVFSFSVPSNIQDLGYGYVVHIWAVEKTSVEDTSDKVFAIEPVVVGPGSGAGENSFCGGIAGIKCGSGLTCQLDGNYPDAGGKCIK